MLQTRLENEQFNSLPLVFTNNRSRNEYITTDRPDSSQLVDLHIYLIPKSIWKNVQHLVQNEAMDDAISAGFVRVSPDMKLCNLRESIEILCGKENYFPREFIFLRSVGRCLTRVKPTQENELKVKNYRPPQTLASEIYLLEGRHEDYGNIPSASPALSSASYLFGNRHQHRFNFDDYNQRLSRLSQQYNRKPLRSIEKDDLPMLNTNQVTYRRSSSRRKIWSRFTQIGSDLDESSPNPSVVTSITAKELAKLKEEQERLRRRQAELERMRRAMEEKKLNSEREESEQRRRRQQEKEQAERDEEERRRRRQEKEQAERDEDDRRRRRLEKEQAERDEDERRRRRQEKEQTEHDEDERQRRRLEKEKAEREEKERQRRLRRQEKADAELRRLEKLELAATKIQASFRGFQDRQAFRERQRNFMKNDSRKSLTKRNTTIRNEIEDDINDDELSDGSRIISRTSIGSTTDFDSNPSRPETRTIKKENRESIDSISSSLLSTNSEREIQPNMSSSSSLHSKTGDLPKKNNLDIVENVRSATVTKINRLDEEILRVSTPHTNDDDTYELQRRLTDAKRQRQSEEEKRRAKELEDQRRRELARVKPHEDVESLRTRLQELHTSRANLEKIRDEVIKQLRHVHQRITLRRRDARDMWKKKYFQEKKKTPPIEEHAVQLKTDLDLIHSKIEQTIDNESKHFAQVGCSKEAEIASSLVQIVRIQHEIQDIQHQVDQAKLRLTTDIKLRHQADNECRSLKYELSQAKMNLNHIKNRTGV